MFYVHPKPIARKSLALTSLAIRIETNLGFGARVTFKCFVSFPVAWVAK